MCFDITATGHRNHKTAYCARIVPVHPELIRIGLVGCVEKITNDGEDRLWPELVEDQWSHTSGRVSKFWSAYRKTLGITSRKKPFYSFRHNFITELRRQRVAPGIICELVGHRMGVTAYHRYAKRSEPSVLLEDVGKLDFGIDLSHLYERA